MTAYSEECNSNFILHKSLPEVATFQPLYTVLYRLIRSITLTWKIHPYNLWTIPYAELLTVQICSHYCQHCDFVLLPSAQAEMRFLSVWLYHSKKGSSYYKQKFSFSPEAWYLWSSIFMPTSLALILVICNNAGVKWLRNPSILKQSYFQALCPMSHGIIYCSTMGNKATTVKSISVGRNAAHCWIEAQHTQLIIGRKLCLNTSMERRFEGHWALMQAPGHVEELTSQTWLIRGSWTCLGSWDELGYEKLAQQAAYSLLPKPHSSAISLSISSCPPSVTTSAYKWQRGSMACS